MLTVRACMTIAVFLVLLLAQPIYASPPAAPESSRTTETSRPKIAQKNEKREATQSNPNDLSAAINELTSTIREAKAHISDQYEKEKIQIDGKSLKAEEKIADQTEKLAVYTDNLAFFTRLLVVVGGLQLGLFFWQLLLMNKAAKDAGKSAAAALETAKAITLSERAYIKISHDQHGMIRTTSDADVLYSKKRTYQVQFDVRNIGKTPAELTRLDFSQFIHPSDEPLPVVPPYNDPDTIVFVIRATMYGTDAIFPSQSFIMSEEESSAIWNRTKNFYILGVAEYIDHFGIRHRAGYARRYDPHSTENNLLMVTWPGYNYDKQRQQGDGYDWDDTPSTA